MPVFPGLTDLMMTLDGDLVVDGTGDLRTTDSFDWLVREINKRVRTINPEWEAHPTIGADVEFFVGQANTREVANELRRRILDSINRWGLANPGTVDVRIVPTGLDSVNIFIFIDLEGRKFQLSRIIFRFDNGIVQPLADPVADFSDITKDDDTFNPKTHEVPTNKYLKRIHGTR